MKESKWYKIEVCIKCDKKMSDHEKYYNNGTCPNCGCNSGCTICKVKDIILKKITHHKWWQIFNRKTEYIGADLPSQKWLKKQNNERI